MFGFLRRQRSLSPTRAPQPERTLDDPRPGDVIQRDGRDWLVEGVVHFEEEGRRWSSARLVDGRDERWLQLERANGVLTARWLAAVSAAPVTGYPPDVIEHAAVAYDLSRRGTAAAKTQGEVGRDRENAGPAGARVRWWRYGAAGEKCLLLEQWGDRVVMLAGATVPDDDLVLLPGS